MGNLSRFFHKQKRKKNSRSSFITQLKIKFLLPRTGCRKVHGKMSDHRCLIGS